MKNKSLKALVVFALLVGAWGVPGCGGDDSNKDTTMVPETSGTDSVVAPDTTAPTDTVSADTSLPLDTVQGDASAKPFTVAESNVPRVTNPSSSDVDTLVAGNNIFAFKLYGELRKVDGNMFYSPYSVSVALAMLQAGAKGATATDTAKALEYALSGEALDTAFNSLSLQLAKRGEGKQGADGGKFRLKVVNQIWGLIDYTFLPSYLDTLSKHYGAGMKLLDFKGDPEGSRGVINDWVAEQTEQRILNLLPQGSIDSLTRLVLTNAIYFNAAWAHKFDEKLTKEADFTRLDNSKVKVQMMELSKDLAYHQGTGYQAVRLPYDGFELDMFVLLPDAGNLAKFEDGLTAAKLDEIIAALTTHKTTVKMPKFEYTVTSPLTAPLQDLGMKLAFSDSADLSGINGVGGLKVTGVLHKAFVKVNENGTEAAAATAVVVGTTSLPPEYPPASITLDRPFIFVIRDKTKATLFVGRVVDPTRQ